MFGCPEACWGLDMEFSPSVKPSASSAPLVWLYIWSFVSMGRSISTRLCLDLILASSGSVLYLFMFLASHSGYWKIRRWDTAFRDMYTGISLTTLSTFSSLVSVLSPFVDVVAVVAIDSSSTCILSSSTFWFLSVVLDILVYIYNYCVGRKIGFRWFCENFCGYSIWTECKPRIMG